ncbi:hypothetical protein [Spongorhabdus nitratireducens]
MTILRKILLPVSLLAGVLSASGTVTASDNAGIYLLSRFNPAEIQIRELAAGASVEKSSDEEGHAFKISWPDVTVTIHTKYDWSDRDIQINGMTHWVKAINPRVDPAFVRQIGNASDILGCVIRPGYDPEGKVAGLLKDIAGQYDGFIFTHQSFYSADGLKLAGQPVDPTSI